MTREELIGLVQRIKDDAGSVREVDSWVAELESNVPDPDVTNYIFWSDPPMSAAEVVDKALSYEVVALPPPADP